MYPQPTKEKRGTLFPWILISVLLFCYFSDDIDFRLSRKSSLEEDLITEEDLEQQEEQKKLRERKKTMRLEDFIVKKRGKWQLTDARKKKLREDQQRFDNAEVYALIAQSDGDRECPVCIIQYDKPMIYLLEGEIYKYGVSVRKKKRYTPAYYREIKCEYTVLFEGSYTEALKKEKELIFHYPLLPENLKRAEPLVRPPNNLSD